MKSNNNDVNKMELTNNGERDAPNPNTKEGETKGTNKNANSDHRQETTPPHVKHTALTPEVVVDEDSISLLPSSVQEEELEQEGHSSLVSYEYQYDEDLEKMTEFELAQLVKHLERERNNMYGDLRNKSWLLDNHSKEYYHYKELIKAYTGDLNHINRSLEQIWKQRSRSRESRVAAAAPMTAPGSLKWSGESGIRPTYRVLDPRKGPVKKTAGVRSLPRLDQKSLEEYDARETANKRRTRSVDNYRRRKSVSHIRRHRTAAMNGGVKGPKYNHKSADDIDTIDNSAATSRH
ncbi:hypothetical protein Anas_05174 [Armadillidium nasatum]|uniref:Uncharacterized protein n=1 Tax=Armadillidium nasatum TaxID=96803 RepID=A0A5N5TN44_9CRUS|nr:hypothetical protein Anas_05174 [Armadillidium nasatum]